MHAIYEHELGSIRTSLTIQEKLKIVKILCNRQSMESLSSCDITYSGRVPSREGDIHNFAINHILLNGSDSKSA